MEIGTVWLGPRCCVQQQGELRMIVVGGSPLLSYRAGDQVHHRLAAAIIVEAKAAPVGTVLEAFKLDDATVWRDRQRLQQGGVAALVEQIGRGRRGPYKLLPAVVERIEKLAQKGLNPSEIGRRVGVSPRAVGRVVGKQRSSQSQGELELQPSGPPSENSASETPPFAPSAPQPPPSAPSASELPIAEPLRQAADDRAEPSPPPLCSSTPWRASSQEAATLYALCGLSFEGEAEVVLESRTQIPNAGVMLALPALDSTGLLPATRTVYGQLKKGVYGLRALVLLLFVMALLRRPRPEALKERDPHKLGDVLGLLRAPEVKTVRRKLAEVAKRAQAHKLLRELAKRWLNSSGDDLGLLYVDGHVRVYHGKHKLPKAHVTQRNQCLPATTDYWLGDELGQPVFVVTAKANLALTKQLPQLLEEIEELSGGRKGTIVFDRGGWSLKLFVALVKKGWHILTYRKGKRRKHPRVGFAEQTVTVDGKEVSYVLSERTTRPCKGLKLREIAELRDDGGQTLIVTSHFDEAAVVWAYRMFARWRQENFFRYMLGNFELDALVDYDVEQDDPERDVPNPARNKAQAELAAARLHQAELEQKLGAAAATNAEAQRRTMRGFKIAHAELGKALSAAKQRVQRLASRIKKLPKRVPVKEVVKGGRVVRLSLERKLFTHAIKAAAYRAETALLTLLRPHFPRAEDEGRAFLRTAMQLPGDLVVSDDLVVVRLAPMSAPRFTHALQALCRGLNELDPRFPETSYRLRYEVADMVAPSP